MAEVMLEEQSAPSAPASGQELLWPDNAVSLLAYKDDTGRAFIPGGITNRSLASQLLGTGDTYVTGSRLVLPSFGFQSGTRIRFRWSVAKTAAGTAAPVYTVRVGTAGATSDTSRWAHTGVAQTAVIEVGWYELNLILRNVGASGVLQGALVVTRNGGVAATGLASVPVAEVTSAGFDTSWASGLGVGLSINAGAASAWTIQQVQADIDF